MNKQYISFRDSSLTAYSNNNKGKTPVVFVHGNSMSSNIWIKQFESNLSDTFHLIAFDLLGCGASEHSQHPDRDYNISDMGDAICRVIEHFNLKDYFIVGHSLGGNVVLQSIEKLKDCKGILTIGTPPITIPPAMDKMFLPNPNIGALFQKDYTEEAVDALLNDFFLNSPIPDFVKKDFITTDGILRQTIAGNVGAGKFIDEMAMLKNTAMPVAFVSGEGEKVVNNEYFNAIAFPSLWQNETVLIPDSAHCPQFENPQVFNLLLVTFIQSVG